MLHDSASVDNSNQQTTLKFTDNDISALDDLDLENLLYACTGGGILGRMACEQYRAYIGQGYEYMQHAERVLASMEARQRGGRR